MATWSVAAGRPATGRCPLTSRVCGPKGCRSVTSTWTGVPPVPGRSPLTPVNGCVIDDQSVLAGVRLTRARRKSACS